MSVYTLKNTSLSIQVEDNGAELTSIYSPHTNTEYLWNANPAYWNRHAPILFPTVGTLKNKSYTYQGQTYSLPQHGFARNMQFSLVHQTEEEIFFSLESNDETKKVYPFDFRLELGYQLEGCKITAFWRVINAGNAPMYFSIGGHPAFNCPLRENEDQSEYFISFDTEEPIHYLLVNDSGLAAKKPFAAQSTLTTERGILPIDSHLFDNDALIIEDNQCHKVSLLDRAKKPYLSVTFDAPLFGLWSPARKNAPFVCIEPWYGRCDASDFTGSLEEREYGNKLDAGEVFETSYKIEVI